MNHPRVMEFLKDYFCYILLAFNGVLQQNLRGHCQLVADFYLLSYGIPREWKRYIKY